MDRFKFRYKCYGYDELIYDTDDKFMGLSLNRKNIDWQGRMAPIGVQVEMQSTGLKDKNGKLIFEGDIVKCSQDDFDLDESIRKIEWGGEYPAFEAVPTESDEWNELMYYATEGFIEIIGNIHQHKHSLEDKE